MLGWPIRCLRCRCTTHTHTHAPPGLPLPARAAATRERECVGRATDDRHRRLCCCCCELRAMPLMMRCRVLQQNLHGKTEHPCPFPQCKGSQKTILRGARQGQSAAACWVVCERSAKAPAAAEDEEEEGGAIRAAARSFHFRSIKHGGGPVFFFPFFFLSQINKSGARARVCVWIGMLACCAWPRLSVVTDAHVSPSLVALHPMVSKNNSSTHLYLSFPLSTFCWIKKPAAAAAAAAAARNGGEAIPSDPPPAPPSSRGRVGRAGRGVSPLPQGALT
jgi:hypothetical protein